MNPVVKAQLKAFAKANPDCKLNDEGLFEVFSIYSVVNGILTENIDPFSAHLKGNEFGLDGVAILVQGEICTNSDDVLSVFEVGRNHNVEFILFQSKTSEKSDYGDISKFFDAAHSFFTNSFLQPTVQISDLTSAKDAVYASALKRNPTLRLFYTTTGSGEAGDLITKLIETNITRFKGLNIFDDVEIKIIGAKALQNGYRSATNSNSAKIEISKPITLPVHPSVQEAFLGFVSADQLLKLVTLESDVGERRINRAVFYDNIRDFNEKSEINAGILSELRNGGQESFIFKNNGVTVVSKSIHRTGDTFELEDYQIVNGCQTSNILFLADGESQGVFVPFRLIGSSDTDFVASIIIGTNKQNEVKEDQFWALTPFMKDLEEFCKEQPENSRIFLERRENQYRNEVVERTRICKPSDLVKSIAAMFLFQPHRAARDYRGIRQQFASQLFQEGHSVVPYHVAALAAYKTDFAIRNNRVPRSWAIYKYYLWYSLGKKFVQNGSIFALSRSKQIEACDNIIAIITDEDKIAEYYGKVAAVIENVISDASITLTEREKVRDYIRSETAASNFEAKFDFIT